ncbi:basic secretory protein [Gemmata sp. SH-PL17]|uniref:basic secretory protein-like protein n=1 Tax=Gemmata sp. SH-PL17 TaxID=1630693 RepID=UPI0004B94A26|nr:basic secretory protein-like protein [Gemmata sp. SH-PL17]AMV26308.1 basic secretory protein [Gemmata sp. SH-PL17]
MRTLLSVSATLLLTLPTFAAPVPAPAPRPVVQAAIESSLPTAGGRIRQFAFDADPATYFASDRNPTKTDHLTLTFDRPVTLKSVAVVTGRPNGDDVLTDGVLEVSADGIAFESAANFEKGKATADVGRSVKAVRVRPTADLKAPLVVREFTINTEPRVVTFRYPVEFTLDVTDAPEMREWAEKVVRVCERQYPMICDLLASEGVRPPTQIRMTFRASYNGVAEAGGGRITGSVKYFKSHPEDVGAMVHETAHCVQNYRARGLPGWLVEGIADYVRFWKFEPGTAGRLNPERAKFDASYRTSAAFLAFVADKYDSQLVTKLNALMREGKYNVGAWKTLTGKTVEELNQEWRQSLVR